MIWKNHRGPADESGIVLVLPLILKDYIILQIINRCSDIGLRLLTYCIPRGRRDKPDKMQF